MIFLLFSLPYMLLYKAVFWVFKFFYTINKILFDTYFPPQCFLKTYILKCSYTVIKAEQTSLDKIITAQIFTHPWNVTLQISDSSAADG